MFIAVNARPVCTLLRVVEFGVREPLRIRKGGASHELGLFLLPPLQLQVLFVKNIKQCIFWNLFTLILVILALIHWFVGELLADALFGHFADKVGKRRLEV